MNNSERSEKISAPISFFLKGYADSGISRFHMPGHKGILSEHDITEIKGADSLYEARGIIRESERNASRLFGTLDTFYSTEGSSQCIRAMLALVFKLCNESGERRPVLAARNVHRSFITAAGLLDLDVKWLYPESVSAESYPCSSLYSCIVTPEDVRRSLSEAEVLPGAVYITSPDYLGNIPDIEGIARAVHEFDIPLLVDNAHGAYLHFLEEPEHPMDLGADMCCDSAHKTLPALTGGAYLHIGRNAKRNESYAENARRAMSLFGSTSPSYLILESLDRINKMIPEGLREDLRSVCKAAEDIKGSLKDDGWSVTGDEPLKITVRSSGSGFHGRRLAAILRSHMIEPEYVDPDYVVLMVSPFNTEEDFERIRQAFSDAKKRPVKILSGHEKCPEIIRSGALMTIRKALLSPSETISVENAAGRICCDSGLSCPPAIPPVICGEEITGTAIKVLKYYGIETINVVK